MASPRLNHGRPRRPGTGSGRVAGTLLIATLCLGLAACAQSRADGVPARDLSLGSPEAPVPAARSGPDSPFGRDEEKVRAQGRTLRGGIADGAAYVYTPDHRFALVASRPGVGPEVLGYDSQDWFLACDGSVCDLRLAAPARPDTPREDALRVRIDPAGPAYTVCLGPPGTSEGALRVDDGAWRDVGADGCLDAEASRRFMEALRAGEGFAYRYVPRPGVDVRGWYPTFGLRQALALAGWLARPGAA
jgi:hypothetical protein